MTKTAVDFTSFDTSIPVPEVLPVASSVDRLPFYAMFSSMEPDAHAGKQPHKFIPTTYWTEEREVAVAKATGAYQRAKLREQFKRFKAGKAETPEKELEKRALLELILVPRTGKEDIKGIDGSGLSLWVINKAPIVKEDPAPEQPEGAAKKK